MLTLIDGNSLLFRAYYGVHSRLTRADGTPTGAVYGFFNMILPILSAAKPTDMFVCVFDASRITFRQDIYPEYKMNRTQTPEDLITQGLLVREGLSAIGMPVLCVPGVEADDVIATLARNHCNTADATRIITSDKDLMQLVSNCVYLYDGMKNREIHEPGVLEKFGVAPHQVTDVQSLMGDSSDNVPGVPGIGPKKAAELINEFGSDIEKDGEIDRKALGKKVFGKKNSRRLQKLNKISHKHVCREYIKMIIKAKENGAKGFVIDAPLLIEARLHKICDVCICVICSRETRIERIMKRDGIDYSAAKLRIESQKPLAFYTSQCGLIFLGDGSEDAAKFASEVDRKVTEDSHE